MFIFIGCQLQFDGVVSKIFHNVRAYVSKLLTDVLCSFLCVISITSCGGVEFVLNSFYL